MDFVRILSWKYEQKQSLTNQKTLQISYTTKTFFHAFYIIFPLSLSHVSLFFFSIFSSVLDLLIINMTNGIASFEKLLYNLSHGLIIILLSLFLFLFVFLLIVWPIRRDNKKIDIKWLYKYHYYVNIHHLSVLLIVFTLNFNCIVQFYFVQFFYVKPRFLNSIVIKLLFFVLNHLYFLWFTIFKTTSVFLRLCYHFFITLH